MLVALQGAVRVGPAAGCDQDALSIHRPVLVQQPDGMSTVKHGPLFEELDTGLGKAGPVGGFQAGNFDVLVGDQRRPVECRTINRPAKTCAVLKRLGELRRIDKQLLGHTAANDTGATEAVILSDRNARPGPGRLAGGPYAARSGADDEEVEVEAGHFARLLRLQFQIATGRIGATGSGFKLFRFRLGHLGQFIADPFVHFFAQFARPDFGKAEMTC